jgi:hypothetical protein
MTKTNKLFNIISSQKIMNADLLRILQPENINLNLKDNAKETIINEFKKYGYSKCQL